MSFLNQEDGEWGILPSIRNFILANEPKEGSLIGLLKLLLLEVFLELPGLLPLELEGDRSPVIHHHLGWLLLHRR